MGKRAPYPGKDLSFGPEDQARLLIYMKHGCYGHLCAHIPVQGGLLMVKYAPGIERNPEGLGFLPQRNQIFCSLMSGVRQVLPFLFSDSKHLEIVRSLIEEYETEIRVRTWLLVSILNVRSGLGEKIGLSMGMVQIDAFLREFLRLKKGIALA